MSLTPDLNVADVHPDNDGLGTDDRASFQALLDQWAEAIVANDAARIGSFAEPDWVIVGPEGGPGERSPFLAVVESGDLTHSEMTFEVLEARLYGDVAVALAHGTNKGSWQGTPFAADEWVTEVFVRRPSGWSCAFSALTPNYAATESGKEEPKSSTVVPLVLYEDVAAALAFLSRAFGFTEILRYDDPAGYVSHAEMRRGDGTIMLGDPGPGYRSPKHLGSTTVQLHLQVEDVDALCMHARHAGAEITSDPEDQSYGERSFSATDPEGHVWTFAQTLRDVPAEEWGATTPS